MKIHPKVSALQEKYDKILEDSHLPESIQKKHLEDFIKEKEKLFTELEKSEGLTYKELEDMRIEVQTQLDLDRDSEFLFAITPEMADEFNRLVDSGKFQAHRNSKKSSKKNS